MVILQYCMYKHIAKYVTMVTQIHMLLSNILINTSSNT